MIAELLAILTALLWAIQDICARKGLESSNATSATLIRAAIGFAISWVLTILFVPLDSFRSEAVIYHVIAGVLAGFIGVQLRFVSIERFGVAKTSTVLSTQSLVSSFAAILILGELLTFSILSVKRFFNGLNFIKLSFMGYFSSFFIILFEN